METEWSACPRLILPLGALALRALVILVVLFSACERGRRATLEGAPSAVEGAPQAMEGVPSTPVPLRSSDASSATSEAMVDVPAGPFWMGCGAQDTLRQDDALKPAQRVVVAAFRIDATEVTVAAYEACVKAGACWKPGPNRKCNFFHSDRKTHPMNCVNWHQASAYCRWRGQRLPTEVEWEKAARGSADRRTWPWGDRRASCIYAVMNDGGRGCGTGQTSPVKSRPAGKSPWGAYDMAGNVWEWTSSRYGDSANRVGGPRRLLGGEQPRSAARVLPRWVRPLRSQTSSGVQVRACRRLS